MIVENFSIKGTNRFDELQQFLGANMPEASFRETPHHHTNTDTYDVSLSYDMSNATKLNELHTKWITEDEKLAKKKSKKTLHSFLAQFSFFIS